VEYLHEKGIPYRIDSTNEDIRYLRNRVRHKLIPVLDEFFPAWRKSLFSLSETQSMTAEFLDEEVRKRLSWEPHGEVSGEAAVLRLKEEDFMKAPPILQEEAIFAGTDILAQYLSSGESKKPFVVPVPRRAVIHTAMRLLGIKSFAARNFATKKFASQTFSMDLGPVRLEKKGAYINLTKAQGLNNQKKRGFSLLIKEPGLFSLKGKTLGINENMELRIHMAALPAEKDVQSRGSTGFFTCLPLVFRDHRNGDRIIRGGHLNSVSDILDYQTRSGYTDIITAENMYGVAAFVVLHRNGNLTVIERQDAGDACPRSFKRGELFLCELSVYRNRRRSGTSRKTISGGTDV